jgi:hypothetical protein
LLRLPIVVSAAATPPTAADQDTVEEIDRRLAAASDS